MSTTITHSTKKKTLVPKLRFEEFKEPLENIGFADVGKILIGLTHTPIYLQEGKPFLSSKNISAGYIDYENIQYISEEEFNGMSESTKPKKGDILFTRVGSNLGNPIVVEANIEFGIFVSLGAFRVNKRAVNYYMKYWMDSNYFWRQVEQKVAGGAKNNLNTGWLKEFKLNIPSIAEQQKIASFLSAVDEKIQQLTRKKELLEQYKKGVMQQIFSGKLRFKPDYAKASSGSDENGKAYPKWEEKRLGEICGSIKSGRDKASDDGSFPLYGSTGRIGNSHEYSHDGRYILIARVGANAGTINLVDGKFAVSDNTLVVNCKNERSIKYVFYYLSFFNLNKLIFGSGQPLITGGQLKDLILPLPNIEVQQKIASYLTSIDTKIESVAAQITQSQTFKKGLLQQMFV